MIEWNKVVAQTWNKNKHRAGYMFKDALKDAKKIYKKGGAISVEEVPASIPASIPASPASTPASIPASTPASIPASTPATQGGKSRKVRKERKERNERKDRKTRKRNHYTDRKEK